MLLQEILQEWQAFYYYYYYYVITRVTGYGIRDTGYEMRSGFLTNTVILKNVLTV